MTGNRSLNEDPSSVQAHLTILQSRAKALSGDPRPDSKHTRNVHPILALV